MDSNIPILSLLTLLHEILPSFFVLDEQDCIVTISDYFAERLGYRPYELVDYSVACIVEDSTRQELEGAAEKLGSGLSRINAEINFVTFTRESMVIPVLLFKITGAMNHLLLAVDRDAVEFSHEAESATHQDIPFSAGRLNLKSLKIVEKEHIIKVLKALNNNHTHAAEVLGITRVTLLHKMKQYGVK